MGIKINEFKKIVTSPVIIFLVIIFNLFNLFIIYENSSIREELKVTQNIVKKFGYKVDDNMARNFKDYYNVQLKKMNKITFKNSSKKYKNTYQLFKDIQNDEKKYSKDEIKFFYKMCILQNYYNAINDIDNYYKNLDIMKTGEEQINLYKLTGKAADTVRGEYKKFNERFKELVKNGEHKNIFFLNVACGNKGVLFNILFKSFIFELTILGVLIVGHLVNYEFDNKTELLTYSTKRGRKLVWDKLQVAMVTIIMFSTIIIGIGVLVYFSTFHHLGLLKVPISSYFNSDKIKNLPNMCWFNMSIIKYTLSCVGLIYVCILLFGGIAFLISIYVKNSYIVFFLFAIIFGAMRLGIPGLQLNSNAIFVNGFTPFMLVMNPQIWFMEGGAFFTFKYYELITIGVWGTLITILCVLAIKKFKKVDIH